MSSGRECCFFDVGFLKFVRVEVGRHARHHT